MTAVTFRAFVDALISMTPTGITVLSAPPNALNARLPAMWPMLPGGTMIAQSYGALQGAGTQSVQLMVAVEAVAQNISSANFDATIAAMDAVAAALKALDVTTRDYFTWTMTPGTIQVGGPESQYWGFTMTVSREMP